MGLEFGMDHRMSTPIWHILLASKLADTISHRARIQAAVVVQSMIAKGQDVSGLLKKDCPDSSISSEDALDLTSRPLSSFGQAS